MDISDALRRMDLNLVVPLETGIIGLQLLGYSGWVQDAFYGGGLVAAVSVAHLVRNRTRTA